MELCSLEESAAPALLLLMHACPSQSEEIAWAFFSLLLSQLSQQAQVAARRGTAAIQAVLAALLDALDQSQWNRCHQRSSARR